MAPMAEPAPAAASTFASPTKAPKSELLLLGCGESDWLSAALADADRVALTLLLVGADWLGDCADVGVANAEDEGAGVIDDAVLAESV